MKKITVFFLSLVLIPSVGFANISLEINNLLDSIFGAGGRDEPSLTVPQIVLPENPSVKDLSQFQDKIRTEEIELKQFERQALDTEAALYEIESQKNSLETEIFSFDEELSQIQNNLSKLLIQEQDWSGRFIKHTKEADWLRRHIRTLKTQLNETLSREFIRTETLESNDIPLFEWLFSDQTVSQIIEDKRRNQLKTKQQFTQLKAFEAQYQIISNKERQAAEFLEKIKTLKLGLDQQQRTLVSVTREKASTLRDLDTQAIVHENQLQTYRKKEQEALQFLLNLKKNADTIAEQIKTNDVKKPDQSPAPTLDEIIDPSINEPATTKWQSPLPTELAVTASFLDPAYKNQFDRDHLGIDFEAVQGTDILAVGDGTVIKAVDSGFDYSYIIIDHGEQTYSLYGHVSSILVNEGEVVEGGDTIGQTGGTPGTVGAGFFSTGPHLHLEIFVGDQHVDPAEFLKLNIK